MSSVTVRTNGSQNISIERVSIECPFCHSIVTPDYLFFHKDSLFALCTNTTCGKHIVLNKDNSGYFNKVSPNALPKEKSFSDIIKEVSLSFVSIYNQAFYAEQFSLNQICGVGYRKALEFLVKDYLMLNMGDTEKEVIKKKFLSNCIQDDVTDNRIKEVAKRATWLGNDETHYVRKWGEKDVTNLKATIDLTVRWIENEIATKRLLEDMPERK